MTDFRTMAYARFPVMGPILEPTAEHYAAEAALIDMEAVAVRRGGPRRNWDVHDLRDEARAFRRVARMKRWAKPAPEPEATKEEAMETPTISSTDYNTALTQARIFTSTRIAPGVIPAMQAAGKLPFIAAAISGVSQQQLANEQQLFGFQQAANNNLNFEEDPVANPTSRLVKVFIADPNESVPLDRRLLYRGDEQLTDLTDTELFFEVPIVELLGAHNAARVTWEDKAAAKRETPVMLEPARIRDLKMLVISLANF